MPLEFAEPAYILRAAQKDSYYIHSLAQQVSDVSASIMGMRFTTTHDENLNLVSNLTYLLCTFGAGMQTIGEEYTDLLPVNSSGGLATVFKKAQFLALFAAEPHALKYLVKRFFPTQSVKDITDHLTNLHRAIFFLFGAYFTLPHRFAGIRMGTLTPPKNKGADSSSYPFLGILLLIQYAIKLFVYLKHRRAQQQQQQTRTAASSGNESDPTTASGTIESDGDDDEPDEEVVGKCMLCLGGRRFPTATTCGHIFCWDCIIDWCRANPGSALCPLCRQGVTAESLVRLVAYKQPVKK